MLNLNDVLIVNIYLLVKHQLPYAIPQLRLLSSHLLYTFISLICSAPFRMSSSGDKEMDTRDFRHVYVRRRRRNRNGSGRVVRDLDLNAPPPPESSLPKTDDICENGDDRPLAPASNLFQVATIIPRRKRSTMNRKPRRHLRPPSPPSLQVCKQSSIFRNTMDSDHSPPLATQSMDITTFSPPPPSADHHQSSASASAPGKAWRCPTCMRIDDDELSKPIIYLKQLKSKKGIKKFEG